MSGKVRRNLGGGEKGVGLGSSMEHRKGKQVHDAYRTKSLDMESVYRCATNVSRNSIIGLAKLL